MPRIDTQITTTKLSLIDGTARQRVLEDLTHSLASYLASEVILPSPRISEGPTMRNPYGRDDEVIFHIAIEYKQLQT